MSYAASRTPNIIKESSRGFDAFRIVDQMLLDREIACIGTIDAEATDSLCLQLRYLQKLDPEAEITIFINSPGGEVQSGLAVYDTMKAISCPVRTVCLGMAASMAGLLFAAGDQRDMLPHSRIMLHDPLIASGVGGSALELKTMSDNLMRTREITAQVLVEHTGKTLEEIYEVTSRDSYFEAPEALAFGLADRIIETL